MTKAIFFDVANTLLQKPTLISNIKKVLYDNGVDISESILKFHHKLVSELILFPDKTSREFYNFFNAEMLTSLGIIPTDKLVNAIFDSCTYLPWKPFEDTKFLNKLADYPLGIISNWDKSLKTKLTDHFNTDFKWILCSEEKGIRKPSLDFYTIISEITGLSPSEILFIGDSLKLDIIPAQMMGFRTLLIDRDNFFPYCNSNKIGSLEEINNFL